MSGGHSITSDMNRLPKRLRDATTRQMDLAGCHYCIRLCVLG